MYLCLLCTVYLVIGAYMIFPARFSLVVHIITYVQEKYLEIVCVQTNNVTG